MNFFSVWERPGKSHDHTSSQYSFFPVLAAMLTVLAGFPNPGHGQQPIDKGRSVIHPVSMSARSDLQRQLIHYQNKEARLQIWTQFELLRPKLKFSNTQAPTSKSDNTSNQKDQSHQESLVF